MQPFFPDVAHSSSDQDTALAIGSRASNADSFDYPPRGLTSGPKRLQYIRSWQPSFQDGWHKEDQGNARS